MKKEFQGLPAAFQKQIMLRLGFGLLFLMVFFVLLAMSDDIFAIVPAIIMVLFCIGSAFHLFLRAAANRYVTINGTCEDVAKTLFSRRIKTIFLRTEQYTVQVSPWHRPWRLPAGAMITVYVSQNTPVYERNGIKVLSGYLAMEVKGDKVENGKGE